MRYIFLVLTLVVSFQLLALSTDKDQPAEIEADEIEFDFKKGTRKYHHNVVAIQGSLRIKADKLHANYKGNELETVTAWGSLARFRQRPDDKPHDVEGWAKKIIVNQRLNTLTLIGKAALKQGPSTARGDTIIYNMANDTLKLKGGAETANTGKDASAPKRKIKDPFADDGNSDGPPPVESSQNKSTVEGETPISQTPQPRKKGRSRLIIQPRKEQSSE